jgi:hypothetical protein
MASSSPERSENANRQRPVYSSSNGALRDRAERCKHAVLVAQCALCTPRAFVSRNAPHVPANVTLICQECHCELTTKDADLTSLAGLLMRIRKDHSHGNQPEFVYPLASAVVVRCDACAGQMDTLDLNTQSLASEMMACRSDHERAQHP